MTISNVIGFDDAPFLKSHRGDVQLIGAVCAKTRMDGVVSSRVRRDGRNSTSTMITMITGSQFRRHIQAVLLQGIAVAGFNVVDIWALHRELGLPVRVFSRREPDFIAIKRALMTRVSGGERKWRLIQRTGVPEKMGVLYVQRAGINLIGARALLETIVLHGHLPEALRLAHLIAGGVTTGVSRGRA